MKQNLLLFLLIILGLSVTCQTTARAQSLDEAATKIFNDHQKIAQAYEAYFLKHGNYPENVAALVADGLLQEVPKIDCSTLQNCTDATRYEIGDYGDSDSNGQPDIVIDIIDGGNPDIALCLAFNKKNTSLGEKAFKNLALGSGQRPSKWPETDKSFCVCWKDGCDENPVGLNPGDTNIITLLLH